MAALTTTASFGMVGECTVKPKLAGITSPISATPAAVVSFTTAPQGLQVTYVAGITTYIPAGTNYTPVGTSITFTPSVSLLNAQIVEYFWEFGDGEFGFGLDSTGYTTHVYKTNATNVQATLRVTDNKGRRYYTRKQIYLQGQQEGFDDFSRDTITLGAYTFEPWTPKLITGCQTWLAADNLVGFTDGQAVGTWSDASGAGNNATQGTGANQPLYKTAILNGKPVLRFDGVNDNLSLAGILNNDPTRTVFIVAVASAVGNRDVFALGDSNSAAIRPVDATNWDYAINQASATINLGGGPTTADAISLRYNSTSSLDAYINGGAATNLDPHDIYQSGSTASTIGASVGSGLFFQGDIAEVIIYDSALSSTDLDTVRNYLGNKYGLGFGSVPSPGISVSGNQLVPSTTVEKRFYRSGIVYNNVELTLKMLTGTSAGVKNSTQLIARRVDTNNYLRGSYNSNGVGSTISLETVIGGVTNPVLTSTSFLGQTGVNRWIKLRCIGNLITVERWIIDPISVGGGFSTQINYTLTGGEATALGSAVSGNVGMRLTPTDTDWRWDDFQIIRL